MVIAFTIQGNRANVCFDILMTRDLMTFCQDVEVMVPTFRIVQEYPGTKSEVRAHQIVRKLRSAGFTPQQNPS